MQIPLNLIKTSPRPVRTSWDEDKMNELAQSIKEQGVIVPIKVRPTDWRNGVVMDGSRVIGTDVRPIKYELVYGHRRVEAARRAGLAEIPAIVEGIDDTDALIQALIENVQREDNEPMDLARSLKALQDETGWSQKEMSRRGIMPAKTISVTMALLKEYESVQQLVKGGQTGPASRKGTITREHVTEAREAGTTPQQRVQLLHRAAEEAWSREKTRDYAESVAAAEDDAEREAILDTPYEQLENSKLLRARARVKRKVKKAQTKERQENPREVKEYIEAVQAFSEAVHVAIEVAKYGKFSPEAGRFLLSWHDDIREGLAALEKIWRESNAKVQE